MNGIPPTPTALPVITESPISFEISLWDSAPTAVGVWNMAPDPAKVVFQSLLIIFIAIVIAMFLIRIINAIASDTQYDE